jgi:hypothetical protein
MIKAKIYDGDTYISDTTASSIGSWTYNISITKNYSVDTSCYNSYKAFYQNYITNSVSDYFPPCNWVGGGYFLTPKEKLRKMLLGRQAPRVLSRRRSLSIDITPQEARARETLRQFIGEEKYRQFMKNGFITIRGKSGDVYQIFPGHQMTNVYRNGQMVDKLCIVLKGNYPPTDAIIMRFLLILNDENEFRTLAVRWTPTGRTPDTRPGVDLRPLPEIFRELQRNAA